MTGNPRPGDTLVIRALAIALLERPLMTEGWCVGSDRVLTYVGSRRIAPPRDWDTDDDRWFLVLTDQGRCGWFHGDSLWAVRRAEEDPDAPG